MNICQIYWNWSKTNFFCHQNRLLPSVIKSTINNNFIPQMDNLSIVKCRNKMKTNQIQWHSDFFFCLKTSTLLKHHYLIADNNLKSITSFYTNLFCFEQWTMNNFEWSGEEIEKERKKLATNRKFPKNSFKRTSIGLAIFINGCSLNAYHNKLNRGAKRRIFLWPIKYFFFFYIFDINGIAVIFECIIVPIMFIIPTVYVCIMQTMLALRKKAKTKNVKSKRELL